LNRHRIVKQQHGAVRFPRQCLQPLHSGKGCAVVAAFSRQNFLVQIFLQVGGVERQDE
jgi:hypothetical protein